MSLRTLLSAPLVLVLAAALPTAWAQESTQESEPPPKTMSEPDASAYWGVDDFFNIREANPNVSQGQWEFEVPFTWATHSDGTDDDVLAGPRPSVKYGVTNDLFLEMGVYPINFGDGDEQGNGDMSFKVFYRCTEESDTMPAIGSWAEMRIPSGDGSSGVDADFNTAITKTLFQNFRAHLSGFVQTANGGRGQYDHDRRYFQWGLGPGFDYRFDEQTVGVLNYLHRSSEFDHHHNTNVLELGVVRELTEGQNLSFAFDVGLDGAEETPNFAGKLQWSIAFGG